MNSIITFSRYDKDLNETFFFTTDHCQKGIDYNLWTACTTHLPCHVMPRPGLESGVITNKEEWKTVFASPKYSTATEILNPDPAYQA